MANRFIQDLQKDERIKTKWVISNSVLPKYKKHPKLRVIVDFEYINLKKKVERYFYERV